MKTVRLWTGRVGPIDVNYRPTVQTEFGSEYGPIQRYHSSLENGCKIEMPEVVWESVRDSYVDRDQGLTYKEAFVEL